MDLNSFIGGVTDATPSIAIAVGAGVVAGLLVLLAQRLGQWLLDSCIDWPFKVDIKGLSPNPTVAGREVRIRLFNRTSRVARVMATPLDTHGEAINGWKTSDVFAGESPRGFVSVAARGWTEFWVDTPLATDGTEPKSVRLRAHFFSLEKGRQKVYPVEFTFRFD